MTKSLSQAGYCFAVIAFVYAWPRFILSNFDKSSPWASYLYQYGLGLVVFLIGLWVIRSSGACIPTRGRDGFWYKFLLSGFCFFAAVHALWIILAQSMPHYGGF